MDKNLSYALSRNLPVIHLPLTLDEAHELSKLLHAQKKLSYRLGWLDGKIHQVEQAALD